jgi:hypothetical protein
MAKSYRVKKNSAMPKIILAIRRQCRHIPRMSNTNQHLALLNEVQARLIDQANASGINLADSFATVEDFKKFVIGFAFQGLRAAGADVATAFDAVLGHGEYDALFSRVTA